jgi:hypothetical protein
VLQFERSKRESGEGTVGVMMGRPFRTEPRVAPPVQSSERGFELKLKAEESCWLKAGHSVFVNESK